MEEIIEEVPLEAVPNQFWGAVKIYTEKPHIINRRICGTVNLWIGVSTDDFCRENVLKLLREVLNHDFDKELENFSETPHIINDHDKNCKYVPVSCYTRNAEVTASSFINNQDEAADCENDVTLLPNIKKICHDQGFRTILQENSDSSCITSACHCENLEDGEPISEFQAPRITNVKNIHLNIPWQHILETKTTGIAVIRRALPKQLKKFTSVLEVVLIDGRRMCVSYLTESNRAAHCVIPRINYSFFFTASSIGFSCFKEKDDESLKEDPNVMWVQKNVFPKLRKWATEVLEDGNVEDRGSLRLIDVQEYNDSYQRLKSKYGHSLVKMWPETTDPLKFVYEDIAIATYLIVLWRQERKRKGLTAYQTFVDLGCGNGLLVYILSSEGHQGLGIDIKKRNIWDLFNKQIQLQEGVIEPSDKNLFPEYDWLIGNHSDELTPWLPVIAAKSKFTTRFFVIPCCAHDFDCKYRRKCAGRSQYSEYLEYIKEVGTVCGFEVWQDKLRIPSTKRVCLVGQERTYRESESPQIFLKIDEFVRARTNTITKAQKNQENDTNWENHKVKKIRIENFEDALWTENFKAREAVQPVRNCTQLENSIREDLVSAVGKMLMENNHLVEVEIGKNVFVPWDRGGSMTLNGIAKRMEPQKLSALKKSCGGLQTLLKNHRHIFSILHGEVTFQIPTPAWRAKVPANFIKTKPCWFHVNHAKGCPLPPQMCTFAHGDADLKDSSLPTSYVV
ncbi:probable tRNA (uracil-O(2)-)-methyltransferase isoform X1 [Panulirus ornatus]|uniref:probable tRNA (uracil-O(2)-)-methyltransferase isoform X1 n=1 Tax=Panulirus ornatus TaxID=150431 RepID=UPI003A836FA1